MQNILTLYSRLNSQYIRGYAGRFVSNAEARSLLCFLLLYAERIVPIVPKPCISPCEVSRDISLYKILHHIEYNHFEVNSIGQVSNCFSNKHKDQRLQREDRRKLTEVGLTEGLRPDASGLVMFL